MFVAKERVFLRYLRTMRYLRGASYYYLFYCRTGLSALLTVLLVLFCLTGNAQDDLNVHGIVSDAMTTTKLSDVKIVVKMDGVDHNTYSTRANGKYEFYLLCGHKYEFIFSRAGYVNRSIIINSNGIPEEVIGAGIIMPTDMSMYALTPAMEGADLSVFNKPIGIATYDPALTDLVWDFEHTNKVKGEIFAFIRDIEKKQKEMDKEATAADKELAAAEAKFASFVKSGDAAMLKADYSSAVTNYKAAVDIKADDAAVNAKLKDAEAKLKTKLDAEKLDGDYNAALDAGDGFIRTEEYENALAKYQEASKLKPVEKYPKDKIAEVNALIAANASKAAKQKEFDDLVIKGDGHVSKTEFPLAITAYQNALKIFADKKDVQQKLAEAQASLKKQEEDAAKGAAYQTLIADADAKFTAGDFAPAKAKYTEAQKLKPEETYPGERIALCDAQIAQLALAEKNKAAFDAFMAKGETSLGKMAYSDAVSNFESAVELIPNDKTATERLAQARSLLAEMQAEADKKKQYDELISSADADFKKEVLEGALAKYQQARDVIPSETYPLDQINKINAMLADKADAEATAKAYADAMAAGAVSMESKKYSDAIGSFTSALAAKPGDKPAQKALDEATKLKAEFESELATRQTYDALIAQADAKFSADDLSNARADYEQASKILNENYPKDQIALIDNRLDDLAKQQAEAEQQAALKNKFDKAMIAGDAAFSNEDFAEAISRYEEALTHIAEEPTAVKKRDEAKAAMEHKMAAAAVDDQYKEWIGRGDEKFTADALTDAREAYTKASGLKPTEAYPQDRIKLIDETLAARAQAAADADEKARLEAVAALVLEGDNMVKSKNYEGGIGKYEEALRMAPERKDIEERISSARNTMLAALESEAMEAAYNEAIAEGDAAFGNERWDEAIANYNTALGIKQNEQYPKDQIEEVNARLSALSKADEDRRMAAVMADFNRLLGEGDSYFSEKNYEKALGAYENALSLIPDSEVVLEKIGAVNQAMSAADAERAIEEAYKSILREADALFNAESYEMARLKYSDAVEQRPQDTYPANRILEIDRIIENLLLADEAARAAKVEKDYLNAVIAGDEAMKNLLFEDAILAYETALDVKPDETYPQVQIEKAEKLRIERDERESERQRKEELAREEEERRKARANPNYQTVTNNSELQAEAFMREAREAEEREKYERIKKQIKEDTELRVDWEDQDAMDRLAVAESLKSYMEGDSERFKQGLERYEARTATSADNKEILLLSMNRQAETAQVRGADAYNQLLQQIEVQGQRNSEWEQMQMERIMGDRMEMETQMTEIESWTKESYENRLKINKELSEEAVKFYAGNPMADLQRQENVKQVVADAAGIGEVEKRRSEQNLKQVRQVGADQQVYLEGLESIMHDRNKAKVTAGQESVNAEKDRSYGNLEGRRLMADEKRMASLEELRKLQEKDPQSYTDQFRSELAAMYPQGVTEESSTLGNKVIITRVVVKGTRGDEYRKVLDKAGNYYFKNGQSISETTWNRETLDAFYKKD